MVFSTLPPPTTKHWNRSNLPPLFFDICKLSFISLIICGWLITYGDFFSTSVFPALNLRGGGFWTLKKMIWMTVCIKWGYVVLLANRITWWPKSMRLKRRTLNWVNKSESYLRDTDQSFPALRTALLYKFEHSILFLALIPYHPLWALVCPWKTKKTLPVSSTVPIICTW